MQQSRLFTFSIQFASMLLCICGGAVLLRFVLPNQILTIRFLLALFLFLMMVRMNSGEIGYLGDNLGFFAYGNLLLHKLHNVYNFICTSGQFVFGRAEEKYGLSFIEGKEVLKIYAFFSRVHILLPQNKVSFVEYNCFLSYIKRLSKGKMIGISYKQDVFDACEYKFKCHVYALFSKVTVEQTNT